MTRSSTTASASHTQSVDLMSSYARSLRHRLMDVAGAGMEMIDEPGVVGLLGVDGTEPHARLLITDDAMAPRLAEWMASGRVCTVSVQEPAPRCRQILTTIKGFYEPETAAAMVHTALVDLPRAPLPHGLSLQLIGREPDGPSLEAAAAMVLMADPSAPETLGISGFLDYLRRTPAGSRYFAAVDGTGAVRGTAAASVAGDSAGVFFVVTHPDWRNRGVGTAMTCAALLAARHDGARVAALDASDLGVPIYRRLGFQTAGTVTVLMRCL